MGLFADDLKAAMDDENRKSGDLRLTKKKDPAVLEEQQIRDKTDDFLHEPGVLVPPEGATVNSMTNPNSPAMQAAMTPEQRQAVARTNFGEDNANDKSTVGNFPGFGQVSGPPEAPANTNAPTPTPLVTGKPKPANTNGGGAYVNPYAAYLASLNAQKGAMDDAGRAQEQVTNDAGIAAGLKGQSYGQQVADNMGRAQREYDEGSKREAEIDAASKDAANAKEDPDRWWHSQGFADKARLTLAAALGGFASGYRGGPNQVMAEINNHIDRDIASQRRDIEAKKGRVADMRGSLAEMYRRYGNLDQATMAAQVLHLNQMDQEALEHGASAKSDLVRANADLMHRQFQSEIEKIKAQLASPKGPALNFSGLKDYSERIEKAGLPDAANNIDRLQKIAGQDDPAGFGLGARAAHALGADFLISQEGLNNRSAVDQAVLQIAHATGRVTPDEVEMVRRGYMGALGNPEAMRNFLTGLRAEAGAKQQNIDAGTDPRVRQMYQLNGGRTVGAAPPPPPSGFVPGS